MADPGFEVFAPGAFDAAIKGLSDDPAKVIPLTDRPGGDVIGRVTGIHQEGEVVVFAMQVDDPAVRRYLGAGATMRLAFD